MERYLVYKFIEMRHDVEDFRVDGSWKRHGAQAHGRHLDTRRSMCEDSAEMFRGCKSVRGSCSKGLESLA